MRGNVLLFEDHSNSKGEKMKITYLVLPLGSRMFTCASKLFQSIMRHSVSVLVGIVLLVTACSPQATATTAPVATEPPATEPPAVVPVTGAALVNVAQNDDLGSFLVDEKGMTLYLFTKDTPDTSN